MTLESPSRHHDPDEGLSQAERCRRQAHRDVDRVCDAWPLALVDVDARGFGTGRSYDGAPRGNAENTPVEAAASSLDFAGAWIAELGDVILALRLPALNGRQPWSGHTARQPMHDSIEHLAAEWPSTDRALTRLNVLAGKSWTYWPPMPARGTQIGGITVGERTNQAEDCTLCGEPVVSGRDDNGNPLLKRDADGNPYHAVPCYYQVWRSRQDPGAKPACGIDECQEPQHAKGLCRGHYDRWHRTGVLGGQLGVA